MKNNKFSTLYRSKQPFNNIGKRLRNGKNNKNRSNYNTMKSMVESAIDDYDARTSTFPISIEKLNPLWPRHTAVSNTACEMYSTDRKEIQEIRNNLKDINGNGKTYRCPICGCTPVKHLDHYIPTSIMPEFSVMPKNLIYICTDCNEYKGNKWLDDNGDRICFNAYFDTPSGKEVLICKIETIKDSFPEATIEENQSIVHNSNSKRELSTYKELHIIEKYFIEVNERLKTECNRILDDCSLAIEYGDTVDQFWLKRQKEYMKYLSRDNVGVIETFVYKGLLTSSVIEEWIQQEISKTKDTIEQ